jgi:DNA repair exonuclease SbcCD ATPase subunit
MVRALALAEQLMAPHDGETQPSPATGTGPLAQMAKSVRYWLWRAGGRKLVSPEMAQVAENYEREIERLAVAQHAAGERALVQERRRVQELEKQIAQMRHAHEGEIAKLRGELEQLSEALRIAEAQAEASPAKELERALAHLATAEDRARLAENKVEVLKEALEITRARAGNDSGMPHPPNGDRRFREAKRAFARMFHPDHGGRDDDAKERAFLQFWPVLERIDRE